MDSTVTHRTPEQMSARRDYSGAMWLVQALTGLILVFILAAHMIAHHFVVEGGLRNYEQVLAYVANPIVFVIEILFVIVAVIHALLGVRSIINDLRPSAGVMRAVEWGLRIVAVLTIGYGIYLAVALQRLAG
jgi:succinate dehydrogenase hydrophobic anchor subunit